MDDQPNRPLVYLVEDEELLCEILSAHLVAAGFEVECFGDGNQALVGLERRRPDLAILDIELPGINGLGILAHIRRSDTIPVIFISARRTEVDKVLGLEMGADDYLPKPFSGRELVARVKAVLRRAKSTVKRISQHSSLKVGTVVLDLEAKLIGCGQAWVELTPLEFQILERMMRAPKKIFGRQELLREIGADTSMNSRAIDTHILNLRRKFQQFGERVPYLRTARGRGYQFAG